MAKTVIVVKWKSGGTEVYSSLSVFLKSNPDYKKDTINNYISRKPIKAYEDDRLVLERVEVILP